MKSPPQEGRDGEQRAQGIFQQLLFLPWADLKFPALKKKRKGRKKERKEKKNRGNESKQSLRVCTGLRTKASKVWEYTHDDHLGHDPLETGDQMRRPLGAGVRGAALPVGGHDEAVAAAAPQLVVGVQLVHVVPGAQVRHALVVHVVGVAAPARPGSRCIGRGAGGHTVGRQRRHAGVDRVPARRRGQLLRVLAGQQREEALAVVLRQAPPAVVVGLVVVCRVHPGGQQGRVGLLVDELQAQALLVGEGRGVVQHDGVVLAPAAHVVHQLVHQVPALLAGALVVVQVGRDVAGSEFLQDLFLEGGLSVGVAAVDDLHTVAQVLATSDAVAVAMVTIQW